MHTSVLLHEAVDALQVTEGGHYIDATYGTGGHSRLIAAQGGRVLALDWDPDVIRRYTSEADTKGIRLIEGNYANIYELANKEHMVPCDGVLFDLGLSMEQIRESGRGFSYEHDDEPLDMRLHPGLLKTAADIITISSADELYEIFTNNAEEISARSLADNIVSARTLKRVETVGDMKEVMEPFADQKTCARIFQALRMEVNHEYDNIRRAIEGSVRILRPGGRLVIITFHPSEDRLVKRELANYRLKKINKKIVKGDYKKRFERSAHLRIVEKLI